jgi:hypothetical protein
MGTSLRSGSDSGQALIEYILIVVISVTLVVSLGVAVFQPIGNFLDNLNRTYVQCLLETGELPQLSSQDQSVVCFNELPTFGALDENGNPIQPGQEGSLGQTNSQATRDGQSSDSGSGGAVTTRSSGFAGSNGRPNRSRAGGETRAGKTVTRPVNQEFDEGSGFMRVNSSEGGYRIRRKKQRQIAVASLTESERRQVERKGERSLSRAVSNDEGFTDIKKKKKVNVKPPPEKNKQETEVEMGFGKYLKIFILIIFTLFVVIVFGSQAMQISKNWGEG